MSAADVEPLATESLSTVSSAADITIGAVTGGSQDDPSSSLSSSSSSSSSNTSLTHTSPSSISSSLSSIPVATAAAAASSSSGGMLDATSMDLNDINKLILQAAAAAYNGNNNGSGNNTADQTTDLLSKLMASVSTSAATTITTTSDNNNNNEQQLQLLKFMSLGAAGGGFQQQQFLQQQQQQQQQLQQQAQDTCCSACGSSSARDKLMVNCMHVFCNMCFVQHVDISSSIVCCPVCSLETRFIDISGNGNNNNNKPSSLLTSPQQQQQPQYFCQSCINSSGNNGVAVSKCLDCDHFLCGDCNLAHQLITAFARHRIMHLGNNNNKSNGGSSLSSPEQQRRASLQLQQRQAQQQMLLAQRLAQVESDINNTHAFYTKALNERRDYLMKELSTIVQYMAIRTALSNHASGVDESGTGADETANPLLNIEFVSNYSAITTSIRNTFGYIHHNQGLHGNQDLDAVKTATALNSKLSATAPPFKLTAGLRASPPESNIATLLGQQQQQQRGASKLGFNSPISTNVISPPSKQQQNNNNSDHHLLFEHHHQLNKANSTSTTSLASLATTASSATFHSQPAYGRGGTASPPLHQQQHQPWSSSASKITSSSFFYDFAGSSSSASSSASDVGGCGTLVNSHSPSSFMETLSRANNNAHHSTSSLAVGSERQQQQQQHQHISSSSSSSSPSSTTSSSSSSSDMMPPGLSQSAAAAAAALIATNNHQHHITHNPTLPARSTLKRTKMIYHCKFGEFGVSDGQFTEPSGVSVTANNDICVADTNSHRIQVFDREGRFKFKFGECGKREGQLLYPNRVAVCKLTGDIVVTERSPTHQIQVYNQYGQFLRKFGANILQHPRGVCVDHEGRIIVVECKVMRVIIFDLMGNVLHKFNCSKYLEFPNGVCCNDKREIFISDNRAHCIKVFNYDGQFLRQIGGEGFTNYPIGVGINAQGEVLVADNHNNFNLTVFTQQGELIHSLESKVKHAQCFDVALMDDGSIVLASKDYRVYVYRYISANAANPASDISFTEATMAPSALAQVAAATGVDQLLNGSTLSTSSSCNNLLQGGGHNF